mgnify:CR=1 FL=1
MKKLNEKELVEVKGGFIGGVADPNGSFFVLEILKSIKNKIVLIGREFLD